MSTTPEAREDDDRRDEPKDGERLKPILLDRVIAELNRSLVYRPDRKTEELA